MGFILAEDFDIVIPIPLRSVQEQRSIEEVMIKHNGEEAYEQVKKSAGSRCLVILDEMAAEYQESDPFLVCVIKKPCTLLEKTTIIITSRPHACEKLDVDRRIEVLGFGKEEIQIKPIGSVEPQVQYFTIDGLIHIMKIVETSKPYH